MSREPSERTRANLLRLVQQGWSENTALLWLRAKGCCEYCGRNLQLHPDDMYHGNHIDHIVPVSKGGSEDFDNLAIACPACNRIKRAFDPQEASGDNSRTALILRARTLIGHRRERDWERLKVAVGLLGEIEASMHAELQR